MHLEIQNYPLNLAEIVCGGEGGWFFWFCLFVSPFGGGCLFSSKNKYFLWLFHKYAAGSVIIQNLTQEDERHILAMMFSYPFLFSCCSFVLSE